MRVLLVGHERAAADRMQTTLAPRFACAIEASAESALAAYGTDSFDVVVAGEVTDGMTGLELLDTTPATSSPCAR